MKSSLVLKYFFPAIVIAFAAWMAVESNGFLEPDEITHFLKARAFIQGDWKQLLDIWGRPACTGLFGIASLAGGIIAARLLAVIVFALTCCGAAALWNENAKLKTQNANPERGGVFGTGHVFWIWMLMIAQPLVLLNCFAVMTEMMLACAWVWGVVLVLRGRWKWGSLVVGLGVLARPEGVIAVLLVPALLRRDWRKVGVGFLLALVPGFVWWLSGALAYHDAAWVIHQFPWQSVSQYGKTGGVFVESALAALAVWMWVPLGVGLWLLRKSSRNFLAIAAPVIGFFGLHAILAAGGWMGSMSLPRYFVSVSPFAAVISLVGLQRIQYWVGRDWWGRWVRRSVLFASVLPLVAGLVFEQLPVNKSMDLEELDWTIRGFLRHCADQNIPPADYDKWLIAEHPYIFYRLDLSLDSQVNGRAHSRAAIQNAQAGTVVITDAITWEWEGGPSAEELTQWGYLPDGWVAMEVAHVQPRWDLSMVGSKGGGVVAMWVKAK